MKVDLGNITARIAFRCARKNFSETILGEGGAEKLLGARSLLLRSPQDNGTEWLQGIYIKPKELRQLVQEITERPTPSSSNKFEIIIPDHGPLLPPDTSGTQLSCTVVRKGPSKEDRLFASVTMWALERDSISVNALMARFHLGWNRASKLVERLEEIGIVGRPEGKVPREVVPDYPEDLPEELLEFLEETSHSQDAVIEAFCSRIEHPASRR